MSTCNIIIGFLGLWSFAISIWCLILDGKNEDLEKYVKRIDKARTWE